MRFKQDTSYEMLLNHGFEAVTSEYQQMGEGHYGMVNQHKIIRVTKHSQELIERGLLMIQVVRDWIDTNGTTEVANIKGAISVYHIPLSGARLIYAFYLIPCDLNKQS